MKTPIVFISGPISGYPDLNEPAFLQMAQKLTVLGFKVMNPHDLCAHIKASDPSDPRYYAECIRSLPDCTDIILLDGWQYSSRSRLECSIAQLLLMGIHEDLSSLINRYSNHN